MQVEFPVIRYSDHFATGPNDVIVCPLERLLISARVVSMQHQLSQVI